MNHTMDPWSSLRVHRLIVLIVNHGRRGKLLVLTEVGDLVDVVCLDFSSK